LLHPSISPDDHSPHPRLHRSGDDVLRGCQGLNMSRMLAPAFVAQHRTIVRERQLPDHVLDCRLVGMVAQRLGQWSVMKRCGVVSCLLSCSGSDAMAANRHDGPPRNISQLPRPTLPTGSSTLELRRFIVPIHPVCNYIVDPPSDARS